jgi:6,7-dimethyl-8-ribityllumazine synthase
VTEFEGTPRAPAQGRIAMVVSRYNEVVTARLLDGARICLRESAISEADVDVFWTAGAFELPTVAAAVATTRRYGAIVALGCVMRRRDAALEFVAEEVARGLGAVARSTAWPSGSESRPRLRRRRPSPAPAARPVLGYEAADAALRTADLLAQLSRASAGD